MTNHQRWNDSRSLSPDWAARAQFISRLLPPGLAILDIGCGGMDLERFARAKTYIPSDIAARDARTRVIDLNKEQLPAAWLAEVDLVTALGVFEYLDDLATHLRTLAASGKPLLFTYSTTDRHPNTNRRGDDWVNDFTTADLKGLLAKAGYAIEQQLLFQGSQIVILAAPVGKSPNWLKTHASPKAVEPEGKPKLVVAGFYGRGNCGDEALLQCIYETLRNDFELVVALDEHGAYQGYWDWYPYNIIPRIHQTNMSFFRTEANVAGLLVGGGGLPLGFAANLANAARWNGCKTAIAGIDVWPDGTAKSSDKATQDYLELFDLAVFRHTLTAAQKRMLEGGKTKVVHGADWALRLESDASPDVVQDKKRVLVTLREVSIERLPFSFVEGAHELMQIIRDSGHEPVLLPFCFEDERFLAEMALDRIAPIERQWWNPRRMKQAIGACGAMISVGRLHPLIFAASAGTPALAQSPLGGPKDMEFSARKIAALSAELGVPMSADAAGLKAFLSAPKAADRAKVSAANARVEDMASALRKLFLPNTKK